LLGNTCDGRAPGHRSSPANLFVTRRSAPGFFLATVNQQTPARLFLLRLRRSWRANTDVDLHRGVFREDDVAAARNEMDVD
jgi:hypothetical protein